MPCQWSSSSSGDPASIKASLRAGSLTLMSGGLHADLRNSPGPTICLNHSNPQTLYSERFIYKAYHIKKILLVVNILTILF